MGELIDTAVSLNIINKAGAWFSYNGEKIGQGRENVKAYLKANPQVYDEIYEKIKG
jgi:recombination protein RecA